jgi:uncharacterized coiled-coil DUF342 family protein
MNQNVRSILEALDFIKERMATKEDLAELRDELRAKFKSEIRSLRTEFEEFREETRENFASLRAELRDIRQRLDALEEAARNSAGLTKEIDHLMERVRAIEKHLGIQQQMAA